jgi:hypothetical protein
MRDVAFFEWARGPVPMIEYQHAGPLEEILGAPQNPPRAAIRSKHLLMVDRYAYCMGQVFSDSGAPESVALMFDMNVDCAGRKEKIES